MSFEIKIPGARGTRCMVDNVQFISVEIQTSNQLPGAQWEITQRYLII